MCLVILFSPTNMQSNTFMKILKSIAKLLLSYFWNAFVLLRMKKVGKWVDVRKGLKVISPSKISLGNNVQIGRYSRISVYDWGGVEIEDNCQMGQFLSIIAGGDVIIRRNALIASYVAIISENHAIDPECGRSYSSQALISKNIEIQENCWIGEKVVILPGVTIGEWSVIGAGSVVNSNIPPYSIAVGNPAKVIKRYDFETHLWVKV